MHAHDIATLHGSTLKQSLVAIDGVACLCKAPRNVVAESRSGDDVELTNCDKQEGTKRREQGEGKDESHIFWPVAATRTSNNAHCVEKETLATSLSLMGTRNCGGGAPEEAASRDF